MYENGLALLYHFYLVLGGLFLLKTMFLLNLQLGHVKLGCVELGCVEVG